MEYITEGIYLLIAGLIAYGSRCLFSYLNHLTNVNVSARLQDRVDYLVKNIVNDQVQRFPSYKPLTDGQQEKIVTAGVPHLIDALSNEGLRSQDFQVESLLRAKLQEVVEKYYPQAISGQ